MTHDHETPLHATSVATGTRADGSGRAASASHTLRVRVLGRALGFWCGVLGLDLEASDGSRATVRAGAGRLELIESDDVTARQVRIGTEEDLREVVETLRALAFDVTEHEGGVGLEDPDGHRVVIRGARR